MVEAAIAWHDAFAEKRGESEITRGLKKNLRCMCGVVLGAYKVPLQVLEDK